MNFVKSSFRQAEDKLDLDGKIPLDPPLVKGENREISFQEAQSKLCAWQEKQILIDNFKINCKIIGSGDISIILLHGWGINSDKYIDTAQKLFQVSPKGKPTGQASFPEGCFDELEHSYRVGKFQVFIPDLPGFGKSDKPSSAWGVDEYAEFVKNFIETVLCHSEPFVFAQGKLREEFRPLRKDVPNSAGFFVADAPQNDNNKQFYKIILIGHSFGGRIAIKFAAKYPEKLLALILTGAAGIKHPPTIKQKIFFIAAKIGKIIFSLPLINRFQKSAQKLLYKAAREKDYFQAQGIMKETFKKVINEDLTPCLEKIKTPTLLVWGAKDKSTPLADAYIMKEKISAQGGSASGGENCKLKIIGEANHSLPYQKPQEFAKIVLGFTHTLKTKSNNNSI